MSRPKEYTLVETSAITIERLCAFSDRRNAFVTVDAPLFGSVMIMNGRILSRGVAAEDVNDGQAAGFPLRERIVAGAPRFWVQYTDCVRKRKSREEMAKLLDES